MLPHPTLMDAVAAFLVAGLVFFFAPRNPLAALLAVLAVGYGLGVLIGALTTAPWSPLCFPCLP